MKPSGRIKLYTLISLVLLTCSSGFAADTNPPPQILINNVHVWDGTSDGVTSNFDPLEATTMSEDEIRAIVEAAADFGTYACAHAHADILLVEGNPLKDVSVMADWKNSLKVIIKDGKIFKNAL